MSLPFSIPFSGSREKNPVLFILAAWDYPDDYGQGIDAIRAWQYQSGSWVRVDHTDPFDYGYNQGNNTFVIQETGALQVQVKHYVNKTHIGATTYSEAQNYFRHNAVVSTPSNSSVFSLQNFTYVSGSDASDPMYYYLYNATLNFSPQAATIYTCRITLDTARPYASTTNSSADAAHKWKNNTATYVDDTADFNSVGGSSDVVPLQNPPVQNDSYYIGSDTKFLSFWLNMTQAADHTAVLVWEYFNGTGWSNLSHSLTSAQETLEVSGMVLFSWNTPYNWTQTSVNDDVYFYIRIRTDSLMNQMIDNGQATHGFLNFATWNFTESSYVDRASTLDLVFDVPINTAQLWTLNAWYIVLGLILVPASGLYLVYGGRKNLNEDKVFYALIAFMIGWGLIVGGILP